MLSGIILLSLPGGLTMNIGFALSMVLAAYLGGSLPFGLWIGWIVKGKNFDIRDHGSYNPGATNVLRVLGWKAALPVFLLDAAKGFLPVYFAFHHGNSVALGIICLVAALLGHAKSLYFAITEGHFSGGKSVATALGGILALQPVIALIGLVVFIIVVAVWRYVSLGSILASASTIAASIALGQPAYWSWIFTLITIFLACTHWRNICNLINGDERKLGAEKGIIDEAEVCCGFGMHSLSIDDLNQNRVSSMLFKLHEFRLFGRRIFKFLALWLISKSPVFKAGEIKGIVDKHGNKSRVLLYGFAQLPWMVKAPENDKFFFALLKALAVLNKRAGATNFGLGALLSSILGGGAMIQKWIDKRKLGVVADNGATATVASIVIVLSRLMPDTSSSSLMVIGASGVIGITTARYYKGKFTEILLKARDERKLKGAVSDDDHHTYIVNDLGKLGDADVILLTTSSVTPIIDETNVMILKPGAIILDVGRPANVADEVMALRPDVKLVRCGLIELPGNPSIPIDFHFGEVEVDGVVKRLVPACLAEQPILATTRQFQYASNGRAIPNDDVDWYIGQMNDRGYIVHDSTIDERTLFSGGDSL